jgi:ABC-type Mn2+/Zn2+ transport systems, permease components
MNIAYNILDTLLPFDFLSLNFMKNAFLALLLVTPMLSLMGTMAVNQRMAFFSDALGHSALTGVGLGVILGLRSDLLAMIIFGIVWAILISRIKQSGTMSADTIISIFSSTGIALGIVILSRGGGFAKYSSLLIGDVLAVSKADIGLLALSLTAVILVWAFIYNRLLMTGINPSLAQSRGIKTKWIEYAFSILVAVCVMLAIRWVGVMLINALLILPAAAARNVAKTSRGHAGYAVLIGLVSGISGLIAAYYFDFSAGAAIVLIAAFIYILSLWAQENKNKVNTKRRDT